MKFHNSALLSLLVVAWSSDAASAADKSVENAFALCQLIDNTGLASQPCEVSGWSSSVTATLDMTSGEARSLCPMISGLMKDRGLSFATRWTLQIKSPYSGENSIAFCNL